MIFRKRARKFNNCIFFIDTVNIEIVQKYTYLRTRILSTGNFVLALDHLKEKAIHALYGFSKISLILTYNSAAWGLYTNHDFKTWNSSPI